MPTPEVSDSATAWYAESVAATLDGLRTDAERGLEEAEADRRLARFGPNHLPEAPRPGVVRRFFRQFNNMLIYVLLAAAGLTLYMGHYPDTVVILLVVFINAGIGFIQENRAEAAIDAIRNLLSPEAHVIRGGARRDVPADRLTPGDLVRLQPGDKIPADLRLIATANLKIEEAALTGEAEAADKGTDPLPAGTPLADRSNLAFSGTSVAAGTGLGVVVAVGVGTEIGGINRLMNEVETPTTPLIRQMNHLSTVISVVIVLVALAVYAVGYFFRDYEPDVLALSVIGLAIGAIPEGLPAIMSIILAVGVQSMAKRKAIVRNLPSVETLGSVTVICTDKTGTLTQNEMTVTDLVTGAGTYGVSGRGYAPEGAVLRDGTPVTAGSVPVLDRLITCFAVCNDSTIIQEPDGRWTLRGEPTEGSLQTVARKAGLPRVVPDRLDTIPFDSQYKYMAVLVDRDGSRLALVKGAPDRLLEMADREEGAAGLEPVRRAFWEDEVSRLAALGRRTLAAAYKPLPDGTDELRPEDLAGGLILLGLAGIVDPPRPEAMAAVRECQDAGITVKMITGDHIDTALAIGCEMGIGDGEHGLEGRDIDAMDGEELLRAAVAYDVFARTSPANKLQLVKALQADGNVVAMTGDGVNDAPALRMADVGVAMGIKGTEVTKDAAEIVLADDNFSTIAAAVEEGRKVYDNLKKTILFILPTNGAECFLIMASILFGTLLPLTPVQILWVNMVTAITVSMALAFEPLDPDVMARPPRDPATPILDGYFLWRIFYVSVLIGGSCLLLSVFLHDRSRLDDASVRTVTMQAIIFCQMFHVFNNRSIRRSAFSGGFFNNKIVFLAIALALALQLGITYIPFMNRVFATTPLPARAWLWPLALGMMVFAIVEGEKWILRRVDARRERPARRTNRRRTTGLTPTAAAPGDQGRPLVRRGRPPVPNSSTTGRWATATARCWPGPAARAATGWHRWRVSPTGCSPHGCTTNFWQIFTGAAAG
ncbi:MAG: HAD-IC family P-type ATPase [Planctomycetes bacterium]|nr:HAD-IC family P-type ATPase [Planctomycetota bacterium]